MCVSTVKEGPLTQSQAIVIGFDCADSGKWTPKTPMAAKDPTTGIMFETPGVYATAKVDMKEADWGDKTKVTAFGKPTYGKTKESAGLSGGMVYTTSSAFWAEKAGSSSGVTMALMNAFLADVAGHKMNVVDLPFLNDKGNWIEAKGVCISPKDKACGEKRSFDSPMLVTIFYGYIGQTIPWGTFTQFALPMGMCLSKGVKVFFNDDTNLNPSTLTETTAIKTIIFYVIGKKSLMYYAIDDKYTTQEWTSPTAPTKGSEVTGSVAARIYPWDIPAKAQTYIEACAMLMIYLSKESIKTGKSFQTMMTATTGEFEAAVTKDMVREGGTAKTAANSTTAAKKDSKSEKSKPTVDKSKQPKIGKVNGGESGKTYGGVKTPADKAAAANATAAAASANSHDPLPVITMMIVLSMLNLV